MFYKVDHDGYKELLPGIMFKTLVHGEKTLLGEFRLAKGAVIPDHSHPHEQTGYLIKGQVAFTMGQERTVVEPGECWCIPGNAEHSAEALEDSVIVEVFSPVREEYL
ncbi:MAG: cupin domain-containing protein [Anaerolineae bacterium]|nr:cupin domain-containing protein [Anaerolineae bacterium]